MSSSVIPSAKYSCEGSPERFSRGRTARDRMGAAGGRARLPWTILRIDAAARSRTSTAVSMRHPENRERGIDAAGSIGSGCAAGSLLLVLEMVDPLAGSEPFGLDHSTEPTKR